MSADRKSLVLVVGAGASHEAKLPLGMQLKDQISELLNIKFEIDRRISGDPMIEQAFREITANETKHRGDINPHLRACWRIRSAMPLAISIDNYLDSQKSDELVLQCGKLAIVRAILQAEEGSLLACLGKGGDASPDNYRALQKTWYNPFFQLLTENCKREDLPDRFSRIAVVCFNYDRCIEHFLINALQIYYSMRIEDAMSTLEAIEIHHPYGKIGELAYEDSFGREIKNGGIKFGGKIRPNQLLLLSSQIRTFTEGSNEQLCNIANLRKTLASAERIVFLGFAFHRLNVELLFPDLSNGTSTTDCTVYATGIGVSEPDANVIKSDLCARGKFRQNNIYIDTNTHCKDLFGKFRKSLSF